MKAFTKNGKATIIALEPGVTVMGQRNSLSPLDIKQANILYNCKGKHNDSTRVLVTNAVWAKNSCRFGNFFKLPKLNFHVIFHSICSTLIVCMHFQAHGCTVPSFYSCQCCQILHPGLLL